MKRKDKNGQKIQRTGVASDCHIPANWQKYAAILSKGKLIFIEGRIQTRSWEDKDGNKRTTTEIIANNMQMLDSKGRQRVRT